MPQSHLHIANGQPMSATEASVVSIEKLELSLSTRAWPFADQRRAEIKDHFAAAQKANPALWNGPILLLHDYAINGTLFRGAFFEADYASYLAWRDWEFPDLTVKSCCAMGAIRAVDGGFLLGVMGAHSSNAGMIYFPAGMTDLQSLNKTTVDLQASMWREVAEETGLTGDDLSAEPFWHTVLLGPLIVHIKVLHARENSNALRERILTNLAGQQQPELADIHIVRGKADFDPMMVPIVIAFMNSVGISFN
jgi:hypothetical protein